MAKDRQSNVVLNFKMSGQVEYAKTIKDINAIMNAAASEYKTHVAAMGKDADQTQKLAAEKKKLEIQLEGGRERTKKLREEYQAMANDTKASTTQLLNKYNQLQASERAEISLENALKKVNEELSDQAIESRKAEEALNQLESESDKLESATNKLNAEYDLQKAQLGENASESEKLKLKMEHLNEQYTLAGDKVENYEQQLEQAKLQYGENSAEVDKYELQLIEARTAEVELANEIKSTNTQLKEQETALEKTSKKLEDTAKKIGDAGKNMSMKVTAPIVGMGALATKTAIDYESAFAGVRKTVDMTEDEFSNLSDGIRDMSKVLPTSASEIAGVAEAAGQLGIENDSILKFTRTIIDLGESTNMTLDQASSEFARFANIVGMPQDNFDRLGSTVVALGNNLATTEADIMSMAMRLAGAGAQVGMSEDQILAFSGALSSVGIEADAGGSAFSKVMINMQLATERGGEELKEFAEVAGMSSEEFKNAFENDAAGAIQAFIGGLGNLDGTGKTAIGVLDEMGIKEVRLRDSLLRAAGASDVFTDSLEIGSKAWDENTALSEEAAQRYETTESQLSILKNTFTDLAIDIGNILIPILLDVVNFIKPIIEKFSDMDESSQKIIMVIAGIAAAIGPLLMVLGFVINIVSTIISIWPVLSAAFALITGPIGLVVAAVAALIAIAVLIVKNWESVSEWLLKMWENLKTGAEAVFNWILDFLTGIWDGIISGVSAAFNWIIDFFKEWGEKILIVLGGPLVWAVELFVKYFDEIKEFIVNTFQNILDFFEGIFTKITNVIFNFLDWFNEATGGRFEDVVKLIKNSLNNVIEIVQTTFDFIMSSIKNALDFLKALFTGDTKKIKEIFVKQFNSIKEYLSTIFTDIKGIFSNALGIIKNTFTSVTTGIKDTAVKIWDGIYLAIKKPIDKAKDAVKKAIDTIKGLFDFKFKWPKLTMPKFSISGSMNPVKWLEEGVPKLSVKWNAKGGIFTKPTIFGMHNGQLQGAGEVPGEDEALIPLNRKTLGDIGRGIAETMNLHGDNNVNNEPQIINVTLEVDGEELARKQVRNNSRALFNFQDKTNRGGGTSGI